MTKIFITGVAGFLGSHLADAFLREGHKVVGCDNLFGGYRDNVPKGVKFHDADCTDMYLMTEIMEGCDIVYHCAAYAYEGLSVFSPTLVTESCYQATVSVATAAIKNKVKRFIYTSSMARYGKNEIPFKETMIPNPEDPYGIAKVASENVLKCLCDTHGMKLVIAVPHNIIGPRQKYDDPFRNVASIMINLMLQGRSPIVYGDGEQKRCFSYIDDCIDCLTKLAFNNNVVGEIINIGPDEEPVTINELVKIISELLGVEVIPQHFKDRPKEVKLATCCSNKARKLLNYRTRYTLKEGLREMINWISQRGTKEFNYHLPIEIINEHTPETWQRRLF